MEYLVDGHNLIGQGLIPGVHLDQEDDEERLVRWLRARQPNLGARITVVFDGGIPGGASPALSGGGVTAVFAARRRSKADDVILGRVRKAARPAQMVVVTEDWELRQAVRARGAQVMRGEAFIRKLHQHPGRTAASDEAAFKEKPRLSGRELDAWLQLFGADDDDMN